ncbi:MAG: IS66 family transposase zinc-finger binding domain-containing protein [Planctomycetes bacterium]|nr:IS66 family transposase zinc-finger binding domain-containing protein [Planctomycetota bacterium]
MRHGRTLPRSLPPSTRHPHAKPAPPNRKSKKKRGGQPGHTKHERPLIPTDQCDDVEPLRHQVWELPEIKPLVTEYQRHRLRCPRCGETTCADLPATVPRGQSGPRLIAFAALLMAYFRQSKRRTALFLDALLNQPCCPSPAVKMQTPATAALRPAYEELAAELPNQGRGKGAFSPLERLSQGRDQLGRVATSDCSGASRSRTAVASRRDQRQPSNAGHVPGVVRPSRVALDVRAMSESGADEQCERAGVASRGDSA